MNRRDFLKFIGMASSATVLTSCGVEKGSEKIIPFLVPPEEPDYLPGESMFRNSTCTECGAGCGVTVRLVEFDPKKLEGAVGNPLNDGALCLRGQSSLMRLYHPDRVKKPMKLKRGMSNLERLSGELYEEISWEEAYQLVADQMKAAAGKSNVFLSGRTTGSLSAAIDQFSAASGVTRLPEYEAIAHTNIREANRILFGIKDVPAYQIKNSDYLLTVGADVVETFVNPVSHARQIEHARQQNGLKWMHVEPHISLGGFKADHRMGVKPGSEASLLAYLLRYVIESRLNRNAIPTSLQDKLPKLSREMAAQQTGLSTEALEAIADALGRANNPVLIAGGVSTEQADGLQVALFAGLLQYTLGMTDGTVDFSRANNYSGVGSYKDIASLGRQLADGKIGVLFLSRTDVVKTVPTSAQLTQHLDKAAFRVAISDFLNDTAHQCDLILPTSHAFESWGDAEPQTGMTSFMQPVLKETLFDTRSEGDILLGVAAALKGAAPASYDEWLKARWAAKFGAANVDDLVKTGYHLTASSVRPRLNVSAATSAISSALAKGAGGAVLYAVPSIRAFDGRSNALPLIHEIPDPLTSITYGSWISSSKENASALGLSEESLVIKARAVLEFGAEQKMKLPTFVQPGMPKDVYTIHCDQLDPQMMHYDLQTGERLARTDNISVDYTGETAQLAITAGAIDQGKREIVRQLESHHEHHFFEGDETLYPDPYEHYGPYRWSISVEMESCIGCSACVAACYIENNIPTVGESEHLRGREMAWIRVQPYYFGEGESTQLDTLVMMCQQCDFAPCENVCPVYATNHNDEGLNVMTYNRCVGTRYCFNNCPYKVRRFNWFDWTDRGSWAEPMTRMLNPDVSVRPKGVMEKCTFCIQRIRKAKDTAQDEGRLVRDGEISPACAQTCPTNAITFGNLRDTNSEVYKKSQSGRSFRVLEKLGVSPGVHYLRKEEHA